jgi:hypothetical protein
LRLLDLPREQRNDRSALVLLALLDLKPEMTWADASRPMLGITQMMDYISTNYGKTYAPNTRETVRRQTIHQFEQAGLVVSNPDEPRPINSPHWRYQITEAAFSLLKRYGSSAWSDCLVQYGENIESLKKQYANVRDMKLIPVTLSDGKVVNLSAGKHNVLLKQIIEEFCPRYVGGGKILYLGDTAAKLKYLDEKAFARLGIIIEAHGKFPDMVILDEQRKWLFLIEAVTSHGPVNAKRHEELRRIFKNKSYGIVYVTAFPNSATLGKYVHDIAWETEVWVADAPTHIIHFNGERFLGPYEK